MDCTTELGWPYALANCLVVRKPPGMPAVTCDSSWLSFRACSTNVTVSGVLGSVAPNGVYPARAAAPAPWETLVYAAFAAPGDADAATAATAATTGRVTHHLRWFFNVSPSCISVRSAADAPRCAKRSRTA